MHTPMSRKRVEGRHGTFYYYDEDELVGLALATYGEYSEGEVAVFEKCIRPGDVVIDVGANIGAFTIPMAKLVGPEGKVYAFEASASNSDLLLANSAANNLPNIYVLPHAASDIEGSISISNQDALHAYTRQDINVGNFEIPCTKIDSLALRQCNFIKIDVDRHELKVLQGARSTILQHRPIIYIENEHADLQQDLIAYLVDLGYNLYWHKPFQFNPNNFFGVERNIFSNLVSIMNVCVPEERKIVVNGLDEIMDIRNDDQMFDREISRFSKRVEVNPDDLESRLVVAHFSNLMQRTDVAIDLLNDNLRRNPLHAPSMAIQGLLDMQAGNYSKENWSKYELRYLQKNLRQFGGDRMVKLGAPKWDGEPTDEPVLIWCEQGFGDQIMFARFMNEVVKRAPNAFLEVRSELFELMEYSGVSNEIYRLGRTLPKFTKQCSLPSLGYVLGIDTDMIKRTNDRYLWADRGLVDNWKGMGNWQIGVNPFPLNGARIGVCTAGSATSERPYTRDFPDHLMAEIGKKHALFPLGQKNQFDSFMMSAAVIEALDLVITVDTAVAHLAGAMGKMTWLLLSYDPDFRWGLKDNSTIWYPSVRIYRQEKFRDWQSVMEHVSADLDTMF